MKFGLLLPHFGEEASRDKLLVGARKAEELGFDSVFVRDHVLFEPHNTMEAPDLTYYDALTALATVGAVTERIILGTGALIPFRHPVHTARIIATMVDMFGPRVLIGLGAGRFDREFQLVGLGGRPRLGLVESNIAILDALFTQRGVSYEDENYRLDDVTVEPRPGEPVPIWYCGSAPAAARFAVDHCQGWLPGRITLDTVSVRRELMEERAAARGRPLPEIGVIAPTSVAHDRAEALRGVNVEGLLTWANTMGRWWVKPPSGRFETVSDLKGSLIAGTPDDVLTEVQAFKDHGVGHLVFDLRSQFDRWFESIELLGNEVLPSVRAANVRPSRTR